MFDYICYDAPDSPSVCLVSEISLIALRLVVESTDHELLQCLEDEPNLTCENLRERCRIELLIRSLRL